MNLALPAVVKSLSRNELEKVNETNRKMTVSGESSNGKKMPILFCQGEDRYRQVSTAKAF